MCFHCLFLKGVKWKILAHTVDERYCGSRASNGRQMAGWRAGGQPGGGKAVADKQAAEANAMKEDVEADLAEVHSIINYIYQMITLAVR